VQNQFILHLRYHYKSRGWDFGGGLSGSLLYASIPQNGAVRNPVAELRPVMEGSYEWNSGTMAIHNRVRIDHRFIEDDPEQSVLSSSDWVPRIRHRFQWKHVVHKTPDGHPSLSFRISNELMVNLRKNTYDQNRVYASWDILLSGRFSLEAGYIWIYQQRLGQEGDFFSRNVLRFSVIQKI
jgi:hypothetical protein